MVISEISPRNSSRSKGTDWLLRSESSVRRQKCRCLYTVRAATGRLCGDPTRAASMLQMPEPWVAM